MKSDQVKQLIPLKIAATKGRILVLESLFRPENETFEAVAAARMWEASSGRRPCRSTATACRRAERASHVRTSCRIRHRNYE
jgi:hypothetical protein